MPTTIKRYSKSGERASRRCSRPSAGGIEQQQAQGTPKARRRPECNGHPGPRTGNRFHGNCHKGGNSQLFYSTMVPNDEQSMAGYFDDCHRRVYPANATIISAGEPSSSLFYIVKGSVSVLIEDDDGHELVLAYLNEGDFFGEIGMFDEKGERSAWVRARVKSEIAQISYDKLRELTRSYPEIIMAMLCRMSLRVRDTSRKLGDLAFKDVSGRIAGALLDLCEQPDAVRSDGGIAVRITRQELGRIVGCSREMASRVLRAMEERRLVSVDGRTVVIRGRRRLHASSD